MPIDEKFYEWIRMKGFSKIMYNRSDSYDYEQFPYVFIEEEELEVEGLFKGKSPRIQVAIIYNEDRNISFYLSHEEISGPLIADGVINNLVLLMGLNGIPESFLDGNPVRIFVNSENPPCEKAADALIEKYNPH